MNGIRLTPYERARLGRQLDETGIVRVYRRTLAVLENDRGIPIVQIAANMGVDRRSVHRWIESYLRNSDPAALMEKPRSGRPRRWSEDCARRMEEALEASPEDCGYFAVNWTVPILRQHFLECTGQVFSDDTIRRGLAALGYAWKRPRYVLAPDPERDKKKPTFAANQGFADPKRDLGGGRNRPVALPTLAIRLGQTGRVGESIAVRWKCSPSHLRNAQPSNREPPLPGPCQPQTAGFSRFPGACTRTLPRLARGLVVGQKPRSYGLWLPTTGSTVWHGSVVASQTVSRTESDGYALGASQRSCERKHSTSGH